MSHSTFSTSTQSKIFTPPFPPPESFRIFDYDGSGSVEVDEFIQVLKNMGMKLTDKEVEAMVKLIDTDGSGDVDYEEFMEMMNSNGGY